MDGVSLQGVRAGYGVLRRQIVLENVDLQASPGHVTALVGPNGVGKTTMLRVVMGFLAPWAGEVQVCGSPPDALRRRRGIGYLPESVALPPGYTLQGLLREGARLSRLRGSEADAAVDAAIEASALAGARDRPLETFSKGMGRRAALAYARLGNPPVLLLDEPLSGLDPRSRARLRDAIDSVARDSTVLIASHDLTEVQRSADVAYVMHRGRVVRRLGSHELPGVDLERIVLDAEPLQ
jgi:ABC-type multidrug transport system ATPase subunit